jgi:hypothetical protein
VAAYPLELAAPSLRIPRAWPCAAYLEQAGRECGATPALLFRRVCAHGHARDVLLCGTHEKGAGRIAVCRDCAGLRDGAHPCPVALIAVPEALDLLRSGRVPLLP